MPRGSERSTAASRDARASRGAGADPAVAAGPKVGGGAMQSSGPVPTRAPSAGGSAGSGDDESSPTQGPVRTCVGCRTRAPAGTLVRVARGADGSLVVDRHAPGRGAWLCRDAATGRVSDQCLEAAARKDAFRRALKAAVSPESWRALRGTTAERENMDTGSATGQATSRRD
jgi:predicted RNA-binding protein YlxR (DUF448 family)